MAADNKSSLACPRCDFVGKSEQSLKVHVGRAHKRGRKSKRAAMRGRGRGKVCSICGKRLKTAAARKAHITRMHGGMSGRAGGAGAVSPLQKQLLGLSLGELGDLHDACRAELRRRLGV